MSNKDFLIDVKLDEIKRRFQKDFRNPCTKDFRYLKYPTSKAVERTVFILLEYIGALEARIDALENYNKMPLEKATQNTFKLSDSEIDELRSKLLIGPTK